MTMGRLEVSERMDADMKPEYTRNSIRLLLFLAIGLAAAISGPLAVLAAKF